MRRFIAVLALMIGAITVACSDSTLPVEEDFEQPLLARANPWTVCTNGYNEQGVPLFNGMYANVTQNEVFQCDDPPYNCSRTLMGQCRLLPYYTYVADCRMSQLKGCRTCAWEPWDWSPGTITCTPVN